MADYSDNPLLRLAQDAPQQVPQSLWERLRRAAGDPSAVAPPPNTLPPMTRERLNPGYGMMGPDFKGGGAQLGMPGVYVYEELQRGPPPPPPPTPWYGS